MSDERTAREVVTECIAHLDPHMNCGEMAAGVLDALTEAGYRVARLEQVGCLEHDRGFIDFHFETNVVTEPEPGWEPVFRVVTEETR